MENKQKISELTKELEYYEKLDQIRKEREKEKQEIKDLKKKINEKKYAGVKRFGKNMKVAINNMAKNLEKLEQKPTKTNKKPKKRTISDLINSLPQ